MRTISDFYNWKDYRCAYQVYDNQQDTDCGILLIHPIGVGLAGFFWERFAASWFEKGEKIPLYNPDLLGCGKSDMPHIAYYPQDWAEQLDYFLETVVKKPVIAIAQGALMPVAILQKSEYVKGIILSGPPAWPVVTEATKPLQQKIAWNLFDSPFGSVFYRYARTRKFLESFSVRQLFAQASDVDEEWLNSLQAGANNLESRHSVFSFLSGFWRQDYSSAINQVTQPTLIVVGETASSISRSGKKEAPQERLEEYMKHFPKGKASQIPGRNVLPYESTEAFVEVVGEFAREFFK